MSQLLQPVRRQQQQQLRCLPSALPNAQPTFTPPLKWAGGKRWLVPTLQQYWQQQFQKKRLSKKQQAEVRLVEPFCGGLAVALGLQPQQALLNDINPHLVNFYQQIQQGLTVGRQFQNESAYFYRARTRFNKLTQTEKQNTKEAAEWFYYLNRTGFNGLCRFNQKGQFNVPFGKYKTIGYQTDFLAYQETFSNWQFNQCDFEQLSLLETDWIYADPPYDVEFTSYSKEGFNWDDQERLCQWLAKHPGPVLASNQATPRILELYQDHGFTVQTLPAPRRIACNGNRAPALEMLAIKNIKAI